MRHLIKFLLILFVGTIGAAAVYSAVSGGIEYQIPIDYTKIDQSEFESRAENCYNAALKASTQKLDENLSEALRLYSILSKKDPKNVVYAVRLGNLYDIIGKDRYAKGNYYKAIGIDANRPEPYFYFGNFYYKRSQFRRALKMYKLAYEHGYQTHQETLAKLNAIYLKLGDPDGMAK